MSDHGKELAELVLSMGMVTAAGQHARHLARLVLGIPDPNHDGNDLVAITTNGTTRFIPRDEPVFLLRAQDRCAANAVRAWSYNAENIGADGVTIALARHHADMMEAWPIKKIPDNPKSKGN